MPARSAFKNSPDRLLLLALALAAACLGLTGCAARGVHDVGSVKRAVEPAGFPQAALTEQWDVAALRATQSASGHGFAGTRLLPVILVLKNRGPGHPQVVLEDVRGVAKDSEYLLYSPAEAERLAMARASGGSRGRDMALSGAKGAGIGAAIGTGFGLLAYIFSPVKDPSLIWTGSIFGGSAGAIVGVASVSSESRELRDAVRADLVSNVWNEDPVAPGTTRTGYLFLPEGVGIESVRVTVREGEGEGVQVRVLPIAQPQDYQPERIDAQRPAAGAAPGATPEAAPAPIKVPENELPAPKKAPKQETV